MPTGVPDEEFMFESSMSNWGSCSMVGQAWLFTMKFALSLGGQSGKAMPSQADCMAHSRDMLEEVFKCTAVACLALGPFSSKVTRYILSR